MQNIIIRNLRIQILDKNLIRIEKKYNNSFEDRNTLIIPDRNKYKGWNYEVIKKEESTIIKFNNYSLIVPNSGPYNKIYLEDNNNNVIYRFNKIKNSGELPKSYKTKNVFVLNDAPHIIIPEHGYSIKTLENKEEYEVNENDFDMYLMIVNKDHRLLRQMYVELCGRSPLVRFQTLGLWNSRYYKYNDQEVYDLIEQYKKHNVPLDNFVIDTDWRKANDIGIGYEIDTDLFPNMKNVFDYAHERNISIMFNDHPEPVKKIHGVFDNQEIKFRASNLTKLLEMGLDTWWYDRNWTTKLISPTSRIEPETLGLYLFNDVTRLHYLNRDGKYHTRPDIMGNVNNIENGVYKKINDSISHRFPIQWTGDITCSMSDLTQEVANLIKGSENEVSFINFDVGGHVGNPTKEAYIKWMQFGAFTPIMRPHCTKYVDYYREPWVYDEEALNITREYINMRYRLLGHLYSKAFENYCTGEPIFKSLSYDYVNNKKVRNDYESYIFGNNILVSPLGENMNKPLKPSHYISKVNASYYSGVELKGRPLYKTKYSTLNLKWNHEKPAKRVPKYNFSALFETKVKFDYDVRFYVRSDDGVRVYVDGKLMLNDWNLHGLCENLVGELKAKKEYNIRVEYFQGGGEAAIQLYYSRIRKNTKQITLPNNKWIDAFNGEIYANDIKYNHKSLKEFPIFIKEGSLFYLLKSKQTTSLMKYDDLIMEYYPSKDVNDVGYIYEDDRKTIAYQEGIYRKVDYSSNYNEVDNSLNIHLTKAYGKYSDDIKERKILFKYHLINGCENVSKVLVNNNEVKYKVVKKDSEAYPFNELETSPNSDVIIFELLIDNEEEYNIKFILE